MIAMMILQDGPRIASYVTGTAARRLNQVARRYATADASEAWCASLCNEARRRVTRLCQQMDITQWLQGVLVAMLVLLLVW